MFILKKSWTFEAAHWLPMVADDHKCKNMHGHSYRLTIELAGETLKEGMVVDYSDMSEVVKGVAIQAFDHKVLNEFIKNPTVENVCQHIADSFMHEFRMRFFRKAYPSYKGRERIFILRAVEVAETANTSCRLELNEHL